MEYEFKRRPSMNIRTAAPGAARLILTVGIWFAVSGAGERAYAPGQFGMELDQQDKKGAVKSVESGKPAAPIPAYKIQQGWPKKSTGPAVYTAQTQQPMAKNAVIVADGISWQCQGDSCRAANEVKTPAPQTCRALALQVGALRSFSVAGQALSAGELAQCNAGSALPKLQQNTLGPRKGGPVPDRGYNAEVWQQEKPSNNDPAKPKSSPGGFVPKPSSPPAAKERTYPMDLRTAVLTVTGTGRRETETDAASRAAFRPISLRVNTLSITGIGRWETEEAAGLRASFRPLALRTPALTVTGTGRR
jgi:hypothetical protein